MTLAYFDFNQLRPIIPEEDEQIPKETILQRVKGAVDINSGRGRSIILFLTMFGFRRLKRQGDEVLVDAEEVQIEK